MNELNKKSELARAAAMKTLEAYGKRNGNRETLLEGGSHEVDLKISGTVDGQTVSFPITGRLSVGKDNPTGSTKRPSLKNMFCAALSIMAKTRRERLVKSFESEVPKPDPEQLALVEALNERLSTFGNKRGAVTFQAK
jgi:ribonuclease HII